MKICNFSIDIKKKKSFKNEDPIVDLLDKCFKQDDIKLGVGKLLEQKMFRLYPVITGAPIPEEDKSQISIQKIIGYIGLTEIRCFLIRPESKETDKISVEVFLIIPHSTFETGIDKAFNEIKSKLERNSLSISSIIKTVKLYPIANEDIYNPSYNIVAHYNTKENMLRHWWPLFVDILILIISLIMWKFDNIMSFGQGVTGSVVIAGILEFITCYKTWKNELNANFEDIWDPDIIPNGAFESQTKPTPVDSSEE